MNSEWEFSSLTSRPISLIESIESMRTNCSSLSRGIEVGEGYSYEQSSTNDIPDRAEEEIVQSFVNGKAASSQNCHRERPHVCDRVFKSQIYEDKHDGD
jgi:hypothetical protein